MDRPRDRQLPWFAAIPGAVIFVLAAGSAAFLVTLGVGSAYRLMTWWWWP